MAAKDREADKQAHEITTLRAKLASNEKALVALTADRDELKERTCQLEGARWRGERGSGLRG